MPTPPPLRDLLSGAICLGASEIVLFTPLRDSLGSEILEPVGFVAESVAKLYACPFGELVAQTERGGFWTLQKSGRGELAANAAWDRWMCVGDGEELLIRSPQSGYYQWQPAEDSLSKRAFRELAAEAERAQGGCHA